MRTGPYAGWVHELAMEFGSTDEALAKAGPWTGGNADEAQVRGIVQAWLMREELTRSWRRRRRR
jgi:hypothetical protein